MIKGFFLIASAVVVAVASGCRYGLAGDGPDARTAPIFDAAVRHITEGSGGAVRIDARIMDSIPTRFDPARDVVIAPTPTLLAMPREERHRHLTLVRLRVPQERIEDYIACTTYIGGVPVDRPGTTPESRAEAARARAACAERTRYGVAILGLPRRAADGRSWAIRVYLVSAETRQVEDLLLAPTGGRWQVIGREELLSVSS